ncbi:uncharacterized protein LOC134280857 [Saccostrea cucullata]|uniref:uncharacterized protein LOC134280857 n=1 Tax=Saccostrea cuccullata TaxID=36930 RepID=UPI002ED3C3E5
MKPIVHPPKTFPAALRDDLKAALDGMESQGVIGKVDQPTEWFSSMQKSPKESSFKEIKRVLYETHVLTFYDVKKSVIESVDSSKSGLGAVVLQNDKQYAQIEKELLAVTFGLEQFHQYTYGVDVTVENDHKPLESILKKNFLKHRQDFKDVHVYIQIQSWLRTSSCKYIITSMPSSQQESQTLTQELDFFVHSVFLQSVLMSRNILEDIRRITKCDNDLKRVKECIQNEWPPYKQFKPTRHYRHSGRSEIHLLW